MTDGTQCREFEVLKNGWANVSFADDAGPFAGWLALLLYSDAAVSPAGTDLLYNAASSRCNAPRLL